MYYNNSTKEGVGNGAILKQMFMFYWNYVSVKMKKTDKLKCILSWFLEQALTILQKTVLKKSTEIKMAHKR